MCIVCYSMASLVAGTRTKGIAPTARVNPILRKCPSRMVDSCESDTDGSLHDEGGEFTAHLLILSPSLCLSLFIFCCKVIRDIMGAV